MKPGNKNSYKSLSDLEVNGKNYKYYSLKKAELNGLEGVSKLPKSIIVDDLPFSFLYFDVPPSIRISAAPKTGGSISSKLYFDPVREVFADDPRTGISNSIDCLVISL